MGRKVSINEFKNFVLHFSSMEPKFYTPIDEALFKTRFVQLSGAVNAQMAQEVNRTLLAMELTDPNAPVYLFINSPGGEVTSGFSIFDTARFIKPKVITIVAGLAASMGSLIALCADKESRVALPNSKFLIHQPLISGTLTGQASDLDIHARDIIKTKNKINRIYSEATGKPLEEIEKATDRDFWMTAEEALDFGLISRIVTSHSEVR